MRVQELFEDKPIVEAVKGKWKIQNLSGQFKTFADAETADARAWMKNRGVDPQVWDARLGKWVVDPKHQARMDRAAEKREKQWERADRLANKKPKIDLQAVYNKYTMVVGNVFPDGDPIDYMGPWFKKNYGIEYDYGKYIDQALKKFGSGSERKGQDGYLSTMWADMAGDAIHDAKNGHVDDNSPYYDVEKDGTITPKHNPWK
jgi:hypothetical protein